jgi:chitin synthase
MKKCGMPRREVQQAWREKIALCLICLFMMGALGFLTFGFTSVVCVPNGDAISFTDVSAYNSATYPHRFILHGRLYDLTTFLPWHNNLYGFLVKAYPTEGINSATGIDISPLFPNYGPSCVAAAVSDLKLTCSSKNFPNIQHCHDYTAASYALAALRKGPVTYDWADIKSETSTLMVFKDRVLDMSGYLETYPNGTVGFLGEFADGVIRRQIGRDSTLAFGGSVERKIMGQCLAELYTVGQLEKKTIGCFASDIVLNISLIVILSLVLIRFFLAMIFKWFLAYRLGKLIKASGSSIDSAESSFEMPPRDTLSPETQAPNANGSPVNTVVAAAETLNRRVSVFSKGGRKKRILADQISTSTQNSPANSPPLTRSNSTHNLEAAGSSSGVSLSIPSNVHPLQKTLDSPMTISSSISSKYHCDSIHTILLVTCYSEGEDGLRNTFDSLAATTYSQKYKLLIVVADGIITGSGNKKSTPDIVLDMIDLDSNWPKDPEPQSYIAIASGAKRHNKAKVYVGTYTYKKRKLQTIVIVKCGTPEEIEAGAKPGNRGKRDSQIILMNFFKRVMFDEAMCPLDFDLFRKIRYLCGVTPDAFEIILMVDADTKVAPDSLSRMVAAMAQDPKVIGLCGETRIANKSESWVSRIQVFEYYLSHHLTKAFESIFGGVTCLPGCFCMYRLKAYKETNDGPAWVPIIINPDIVATYSESNVDTLHKKNLLLLGEDRFLTTLILREFPHRKLIFVPSAFCKTVVPAEFNVLLSQRRRWINSTIHNLLELVLVKELCGIFCFSMQFVIMLELIGTVTLPAAISFTL